MSEFRRVTGQLSVSPQISVADVADAKAQGFAAIINNRPDGEAPDQPAGAEIEAAARQAGLAYAYIPVVGGLVMLLERFVSPDIPGAALAIAWMLMLLLAWYRLLSFACPRCSEWFHTKWFGWVSLGRRCVHCGLERGARYPMPGGAP